MNPFLNCLKCIILLSLFSCSAVLQDKKKESFDSAKITMDKSNQAPSQIRFSPGNEIALKDFWKEYSGKFNLTADDTFEIFKTTSDKSGQNHHRFKQYYKGIEVADMQYILHEENGMVQLANGKIIHGLDMDIKPSLNETEALETTYDQLGIQQKKKAASNPKGKLMISATGKKAQVDNFRLVYRFDIYSKQPSFAHAVDVDAHSGKILNKVPLIMTGG